MIAQISLQDIALFLPIVAAAAFFVVRLEMRVRALSARFEKQVCDCMNRFEVNGSDRKSDIAGWRAEIVCFREDQRIAREVTATNYREFRDKIDSLLVELAEVSGKIDRFNGDSK
jgi:hypothetical protein